VWWDLIVFPSPPGYQYLRLDQRGEQFPVQQFIPLLAVDGLGVTLPLNLFLRARSIYPETLVKTATVQGETS